MAEGVRHLQALERADRASHVLARLVAGGLDRLLDRKHVLPRLPAVALVHDAVAALLAGVDVVDADQAVELAVVLVVLVLELAREVLEEIPALGRALEVVGADRLDARRGGEHLHALLQAHGLGLRVEGDRQRADEGRQHDLGVVGDLREVRDEVLGVERHGDGLQHLAAEALDHRLRLVLGALAPGVVGVDDGPDLAEVLVAPGHAGGGDRVGVGAGAEAVARALRAGRLGRLAGGEVGRLQLARDRDRGQHHAGMHRADDELGAAALNEVADLARAGRGIRFGVLGDQLDLALGDAALLVDELDRLVRGEVVPVAP